MNLLTKAFAFIQRDIIRETSYKFAFISQFFSIFFSVSIFFFLSKLFGNKVIPNLEPYGGNYFSFVLIGVAFSNYLEVSLQSHSRNIREAQMMGTLEALLVTQTQIPMIILSSSLYNYIFTSFRVIIYILFGIFVFGMDIGSGNIPGAFLILILTITSFSSLGIISASFTMIFKKGDPLAWLFTNLSWLLGGVYYPISILPKWLQKLSMLLPITHALDGMRFALIKNYSLAELLPNILSLLVFSIVLLPLSIIIFGKAVKKAKIDGSLAQY